jgi:hypothetical protein
LQQRTWSWLEFWTAVSFALLLALIFLYYLWRMEPQLWLRRSEVLLRERHRGLLLGGPM